MPRIHVLSRAVETLEPRLVLSVTTPTLALAAASDSGTVGDRITNISAPVLSGAADAGTTVTLYDGATLLGTTSADSSGQWSFTTSALGDGSHSFMATASDGVTSASSATLSVTIDTVAPILNAVRVTAPNASGWNRTNVATSYSASDALSGLASPANGSFIFQTAGANQSHTFTVVDVAGNATSATLSGVNIDKTAPTISAQRLTAANAFGWNNTDVATSYSAADALSGLASAATGSFTFTSEGTNQFHTFTVTDLAGNSASVTISGVNIDKTAPTLTVRRDTAANSYGWNNTDVSSSYTAADGLSGLGSTSGSGSFLFTAEGANQSHAFTVTDVAGNVASASVSSVNIDKTAPTLCGGADRSCNVAG